MPFILAVTVSSQGDDISDALRLAKEIQSDRDRGAAMCAIVSNSLSKVEFFERAETVARMIKETSWRSSAEEQIIKSYIREGHLDSARRLVDKVKHPSRRSVAHAKLADAYYRYSQPELAEGLLQESQRSVESTKTDSIQIMALLAIAGCQTRHRTLAEGRETFQRAFAASQRLDVDYQKQRYAGWTLQAQARAGDLETAIKWAEELPGQVDRDFCFNCIVGGLLEADEMQSALEVLRRIDSAETRSSTMLQVFTRLAIEGQIEKARRVMKQITIPPQHVVETISITLSARCSVDDFKTFIVPFASRYVGTALALCGKLPAVYPGRVDADRLGRLVLGDVDEANLFVKARKEVASLVENHPDEPDFALALGVFDVSRGQYAFYTGDVRTAIKCYKRAITIFQRVLNRSPDNLRCRESLGMTIGAHAVALRYCGRFDAALMDLDWAQQLDDDSKRLRRQIGKLSVLAHRNEYERATSEAETAIAHQELDAHTAYELACLYGLAALTAKETNGPHELLESEAIQYLRRAVAEGFKNLHHMRRDPDLASLRFRPEFQELAGDIENELQRQREMSMDRIAKNCRNAAACL